MAQSITDPRLLSYDPDTGDTVWFHSDASGQNFVVERVSDVEPLVEFNKVAVNKDHGGWGDGRMVAQFPMTVYEELRKAGILHDQKAMAKWLNDRDNLAWRIRPGKI